MAPHNLKKKHKNLSLNAAVRFSVIVDRMTRSAQTVVAVPVSIAGDLLPAYNTVCVNLSDNFIPTPLLACLKKFATRTPFPLQIKRQTFNQTNLY